MDDIVHQSIPSKQCNGCKRVLPTTPEFFRRDRTKNDGWYTLCKECTSPEGKKRREEEAQANKLPEGLRKCTKCGEIKPATKEFFDLKIAKTGKLQAECKPCKAARWQNHLQENPEYWHNWYIERSEHIKESVNAYYQEHAEEKRAYTRNRVKNNPDKWRAYNHNRRARKKQIGGSYTEQDIKLQYKRQKGKCYYCHKPLKGKYHVDHIVPITRDGSSNAPWNLVVTCKTCNLRKSNRLPHEWPEGGRLL